MKLITAILFVFGIANSAQADWICSAYCYDAQWILMTENAEHPVEALNKIVKRCAAVVYEDGKKTEVALYTKTSMSSDQATVENSCKLFDITKY